MVNLELEFQTLVLLTPNPLNNTHLLRSIFKVLIKMTQGYAGMRLKSGFDLVSQSFPSVLKSSAQCCDLLNNNVPCLWCLPFPCLTSPFVSWNILALPPNTVFKKFLIYFFCQHRVFIVACKLLLQSPGFSCCAARALERASSVVLWAK